MKLLIIGSKGFIGSHAYLYFSAQEHIECWGTDIYKDESDGRYIPFPEHNGFDEVFKNIPFDACINCSGAASVPDSLSMPLRDFELNTYGVIKILEAIRQYSPQCKFINLSSAAIYGNPEGVCSVDQHDPRPISPYGMHKLYAELICKEYSSFFQIRTCSLRIFSAYGPGLKRQILWDIVQKSLKGDTLQLHGTGNESRDFIFVSDIIAAIELVLEKGEFQGGVYNLASGSEVSIRVLAEMLTSAMDYKGLIRFSGAGRAGDPANWSANIDSLKKLGFCPKVSLSEGIAIYLKWLGEEKSA